MPAITDFANNAAAIAAGYTRTQTVRATAPRYLTVYEKPVAGSPGEAGFTFRAEGSSDVDQATADTLALTALNANRRHRYSGSPGRASGSSDSPHSRGGSHTPDTT